LSPSEELCVKYIIPIETTYTACSLRRQATRRAWCRVRSSHGWRFAAPEELENGRGSLWFHRVGKGQLRIPPSAEENARTVGMTRRGGGSGYFQAQIRSREGQKETVVP
jgi:hypothetical protein